jgi:hypothetical protein
MELLILVTENQKFIRLRPIHIHFFIRKSWVEVIEYLGLVFRILQAGITIEVCNIQNLLEQ